MTEPNGRYATDQNELLLERLGEIVFIADDFAFRNKTKGEDRSLTFNQFFVKAFERNGYLPESLRESPVKWESQMTVESNYKHYIESSLESKHFNTQYKPTLIKEALGY